MKPIMERINIDKAAVFQLVKKVGREELLPRFAQVAGSLKADGSLVTEADIIAQKKLAEGLLQLLPGSVVLGEEMTASEQAHCLSSGQPLWCLDPLDGTSNFTAGIPYFSISIALIENEQVIFGVVYDPVRDELFDADLSSAGQLNGVAVKAAADNTALKESIALVDFKRLPAALSARMVSEPAYRSQRSFGSVALDWCWLAANRVQVYLHGQANLWDYAAGQFIFQRSGGFSSTLAGDEIFRPELVTRSCVGAGNAMLFDEWQRYLDIPQLADQRGLL